MFINGKKFNLLSEIQNKKGIEMDKKSRSKKVKLPKELWIKGKSKFLLPRLKEVFGELWESKTINDLS